MKNIEMMKIEMVGEELLTCEFCNRKSKDVEELFDPFELEMTGGQTLCNMCDACYMDRKMDV